MCTCAAKRSGPLSALCCVQLAVACISHTGAFALVPPRSIFIVFAFRLVIPSTYSLMSMLCDLQFVSSCTCLSRDHGDCRGRERTQNECWPAPASPSAHVGFNSNFTTLVRNVVFVSVRASFTIHRQLECPLCLLQCGGAQDVVSHVFLQAHTSRYVAVAVARFRFAHGEVRSEAWAGGSVDLAGGMRQTRLEPNLVMLVQSRAFLFEGIGFAQ